MASHFGSWDDSGSSEDPTSIVRVLKDFESSRRKTSAAALKRKSSSPSSAAAMSSMGPKPKQLHFDLSISTLSPSCTSTRMVPPGMRFKQDPLVGIGGAEGSAPNAKKVLSEAEREVMRLRNELLQKESELVDARAANARWEAQFERAQVAAKRERLERDGETKRAATEAARAREEAEGLRRQLDANRKRELARAEAELNSSKAHLETAKDAVGEIAELGERNESLQRKVLELRAELEETEREAREEVGEFMRQAEEARSQLEEARALLAAREEEGERAARLRGQLEAAELRAKTAEMEAERAQSELRSNQGCTFYSSQNVPKDLSQVMFGVSGHVSTFTSALVHTRQVVPLLVPIFVLKCLRVYRIAPQDAVVERNAMKDQLSRYPALVRENEALQNENKLLRDTADNIELLKEENAHLVGQLERSEAAASEGLRVKHELAQAQKHLRKWEVVCKFIEFITNRAFGVLSPCVIYSFLS